MSIGAIHEKTGWHYDLEGDVLYIALGQGGPSLAREVTGVEGLHIEYSIATNKVTGAVIVWYSQQNPEVLRRNMPFPFDFSQIPRQE